MPPIRGRHLCQQTLDPQLLHDHVDQVRADVVALLDVPYQQQAVEHHVDSTRDAARLAHDFPGLRIVINHAGSPVDRGPADLQRWRAGLERLAQEPNAWIKISDLAAYDHNWTVDSYRPIVLAVIAAFGVERCMFGSDFPVAGLHGGFAAHFDAFRTIVADLPEAAQRSLFHDNAAAFYRL